MTLLERLIQIYPSLWRKSPATDLDCPCYYGLEPHEKSPCRNLGPGVRNVDCEVCWNRQWTEVKEER